MSVFGKILSNLGLRKDKEVATEPPKPAAGKDTAMADRIAKLRASRREQKLKEVTVVDVMGKLEKMAEENPAELNWKTSIVDLLKQITAYPPQLISGRGRLNCLPNCLAALERVYCFLDSATSNRNCRAHSCT